MIEISIRRWGEESAVKTEVYHWSFVIPKQEENTFGSRLTVHPGREINGFPAYFFPP